MANTWDPTANLNFTLSGGNLIASNAANANANLRSYYAVPAGGGYVEITAGSQSYLRYAICSSSYPIASGVYWNNPYSTGYVVNDGGVWHNGSSLGVIQSGVLARTCIAINGTYWWLRNASGNWNNNGTADPATNTGGIAHSLTGNIFLLLSADQAGDSATAAFSSASWTYSPPSGFGELEAVPTAANVSQQYVIVVHETDPPQNAVQARVSQQYIIVAHSPTPVPPSGSFKYHQPIINLDP